MVNGGHYNIFGDKLRTQKVAERFSSLLKTRIAEDEGSKLVCKSCYRKLVRYEGTLNEIEKLKEKNRASLEKWRRSSGQPKRCH